MMAKDPEGRGLVRLFCHILSGILSPIMTAVLNEEPLIVSKESQSSLKYSLETTFYMG